jgi:hypothetical protein
VRLRSGLARFRRPRAGGDRERVPGVDGDDERQEGADLVRGDALRDPGGDPLLALAGGARVVVRPVDAVGAAVELGRAQPEQVAQAGLDPDLVRLRRRGRGG